MDFQVSCVINEFFQSAKNPATLCLKPLMLFLSHLMRTLDYSKHIFSDQLSAEQKRMVGNRSNWDKSLLHTKAVL